MKTIPTVKKSPKPQYVLFKKSLVNCAQKNKTHFKIECYLIIDIVANFSTEYQNRLQQKLFARLESFLLFLSLQRSNFLTLSPPLKQQDYKTLNLCEYQFSRFQKIKIANFSISREFSPEFWRILCIRENKIHQFSLQQPNTRKFQPRENQVFCGISIHRWQPPQYVSCEGFFSLKNAHAKNIYTHRSLAKYSQLYRGKKRIISCRVQINTTNITKC
eukprot:TRINITY_DN15269_c0_g2_i1.p1 TRINITY_DN15269_c0_g2~~TRINITY_DN15269_c0_g2_i1.p1  ORF type:complete len:217 (-),score=-17.03 TRINITY_DN15269_c0_g2_i1:222-872(-)